MRRLFTAAFVLITVPAWAQRFEVAPLTVAGVTTDAPLAPTGPGVTNVEIAGGFTYGAQAAYLLSPHTSIEASWTHQNTSMNISTPTSLATLYYMDVTALVGNFAYGFRGGSHRVQPFVFAGAGVGWLKSTDVDGQAKYTWDVGGGLKYFPMRHVGARFDGRYQPIHLGTTTTDYCSPFSFCQGALKPFQFSSALVLRF